MSRWTSTVQFDRNGAPRHITLVSDPSWFVRDEDYVIEKTRTAIQTAIERAVINYNHWNRRRVHLQVRLFYFFNLLDRIPTAGHLTPGQHGHWAYACPDQGDQGKPEPHCQFAIHYPGAFQVTHPAKRYRHHRADHRGSAAVK